MWAEPWSLMRDGRAGDATGPGHHVCRLLLGLRTLDVDDGRTRADPHERDFGRPVRRCPLAVDQTVRHVDVVAGADAQSLMTTRSELKFHGAAEHVEVRVRVAMVVPPAPDTRFGSDDAYPSIVRSERLLPDHPGRRRSGRNRSLRGADRSWPCGIHVHLRGAARGYVQYPNSHPDRSHPPVPGLADVG